MQKNLGGHELTIQDSGAPRGERNHWEVTLNGVVLYSDYNGKKANQLHDAVESALTDMGPKSAQLPIQGGEAVDDVFVVGYHCRDDKGLATLNWLPHSNAVPLMTVVQHQRILAASVGSAEPVAWVHPAYLKPGALGFEASVCRLSSLQVPLYTHPADQVEDDLTMVKVSRELLQDLRDLASDAVENHRQAFAGYKLTQQASMDHIVAKADALLAKP